MLLRQERDVVVLRTQFVLRHSGPKIVARKYVRTELRQDGRIKIFLIAATYEGLADEGWEGCDVAYGATQVLSKTYVKD